MAIILYGVAIHKAAASGDLEKMRAMLKQGEEWLAETGNVSAALEVLRLEIAKLERK
ncbi:MAG: DUF1843 domain-containing protein [Bacteroidota bacterium]